jgi:hypothetical protein
MIWAFRALLDNTRDTTHRMNIYNCTGEGLKHNGRNKRYISNEQLHAMELCIYHGITAQVEGIAGEYISPMCRCIGAAGTDGTTVRA